VVPEQLGRPAPATLGPPRLGAVLDLEPQLRDDERDIRDTVRRFATDRLAPRIAQWWEEGILPRDLAKELGAIGLLGMNLTGYGCAGVSAVAYGLACMELEAVDSGLRSFVSVQGSLAMAAIWHFGTASQKEQWLPAMAAGEVIGCFGLTEPDAGSDPAAMSTTARPDGDGWVLSGTKLWITNGTIADLAVVWARTPDGIGGFLVPTSTPGFSAREVPRKLSLRASATAELTLEECRVPGDHRLPGARSLRGPLTCLDEARFGIAFGVLGAARSCFETARTYALERRAFGRPIASFQLTQRKLALMAAELDRSLLLALHLGREKEAGRLRAEQVSLGKLTNTHAALEIARSARSVLGANGITLDYALLRHVANLESVLTYEGTEEIHTLVLGQHLTGLSAFT
jgi:glutaryl-CoA dehydrogenase